jgi:hypothetical protein
MDIVLEWQRLRRIERLLIEAKKYLWIKDGCLQGTLTDAEITEPLFAKAMLDVPGPFKQGPAPSERLSWVFTDEKDEGEDQ